MGVNGGEGERMGGGHTDFTKCFLWVVFKRTVFSGVVRIESCL